MSSEEHLFPAQLLQEATALKKVTFSNVTLINPGWHYFIDPFKPIVLDKLCIRNCTGTSEYIFLNITAKSLEIHGDEMTITWPNQRYAWINSPPYITDYHDWLSSFQVVDLKLHNVSTPSSSFAGSPLSYLDHPALKRASVSINYMSRVNLVDRLPSSLEVLEVRDCDPTGTRESWIQDILYKEAAPILPNLRSIHVHFSTKPSQEAVRFHKFLQMQLILEKDIAYRFSYG